MNKIVQISMACLSFIFASLTHANFAKIVDNDGYVNIRQDKSSKSKVLGQVASQQFVYVHDEHRFEKWIYSYTGQDQTISIPQYALDGLFAVYLNFIKVYYHKADKTLYIAADSGSGAGSYVVLFVIKNGVYQGKTIIGYPA